MLLLWCKRPTKDLFIVQFQFKLYEYYEYFIKSFLQKMEPTPTADLDRTNDLVYECTTKVVKAIMVLSQGRYICLRTWNFYIMKLSFF